MNDTVADLHYDQRIFRALRRADGLNHERSGDPQKLRDSNDFNSN